MAAIERVFAVLTAAVAAFYLIMNLVELFKRRRKSRGHWLPLLLLLALPAISEAACDTTTVQNQINAASSGDTVTGSAVSAGTGFTSRSTGANGAISESQVQTSSGSIAATFTTNTGYSQHVSGIFAMKESGGGGGAVKRMLMLGVGQ